MRNTARLVIVAAMTKKGRVIGRDNGLLWHIPEDMRRFKELTANHPVVMGRKTFESILEILGKPLPGRPNIVISRNTNLAYEGATVVNSLAEALSLAETHGTGEIHIGGGAEIYKQSMPMVDALYLTFVDDEQEGDAVFPPFENDFAVHTEHPVREHNGLSYQWVDYIRKDQSSL
jgi:dihydrofolate reductase